MKYSFNDILTAEIYENAKVMFVFGKYTWFNDMVCDTMRATCAESDRHIETSNEISAEFGIDESQDDGSGTNSVDFNTFIDVIGVASITGKWYCRTLLDNMTSKQKDALNKYIKSPSENGILVIESTNWQVYREYLKNRVINISREVHMMQLSFPGRRVLKSIVKDVFESKGIDINNQAVDFFVMRMSSAYDKYEDTINSIVDEHGQNPLELKEIKTYMKGIENYVIDDYMWELAQPRPKTLKMAVSLQDEMGATDLARQVAKRVDECVEFRTLINTGFIPIGIKYFYKDTIESLPDSIREKYEGKSEWVFRKKAELASRTSLRDWEYINLILNRSLSNYMVSPDEMENQCKRALYDISTRTNLSVDRINNLIGIDNVFDKDLNQLDKVIYKDIYTESSIENKLKEKV
jgi:hypothetical protein